MALVATVDSVSPYLIDEVASTDVVRLRVIPEPATAMLMVVAGLIALACARAKTAR